MPQYLGTSALQALYLGTTPIQVLYLGSVIVWQNELVYTVSSTVTDFNPATVFGADWAANKNKRVINASGNAINTMIINSAFGGALIIENRGIISGRGGAANSGVGGNAITNSTGLTITLINASGATIRGGGGGGGKGGNGGAGQTSSVVRTPASGYYDESVGGGCFCYYDTQPSIYWMGAYIGLGSTSIVYNPGTVIATIGGFSYIVGASSFDGEGFLYQLARSGTTTVGTTGGVAGNAGRGEGHDGAATSGSGPVAGGTNAGNSGASGAGGSYGNTGTAGSTGASGNVGAGTAGTAAGLAGYAYTGAFSVSNSGTVQGRT